MLVKKGPVDDETSPEGKLKPTLNCAILEVRKREVDKAEFSMSQKIQYYDGITFCYDIMGNLALDFEQYKKAREIYKRLK